MAIKNSLKHQATNRPDFRLVRLQNQLANELIDTNSVVIPFSLLQAVLKLEKNYHLNDIHCFRSNSHKMNMNHVTSITIRVLISICRTFNTEGYLSGVSLHRIYQAMNKEYESGCSIEQFYAEAHKLVHHGFLEVSTDGLMKKYSLAPELLKNKRYIIVSPAIFTKAFTSLSASAQKLYLYMLSRCDNNRTEHKFTENIDKDSWIFTLTHKNRPSQIANILEELHSCEALMNTPLLSNFKVYFDVRSEQNMISVTLTPEYVIPNQKGWNYRSVLKGKLPYHQTVNRVRNYLVRYSLSEIFEMAPLKDQFMLIKLLNNRSKQMFKYIFSRLKEFFNLQPSHDLSDAIKQIKREVSIPEISNHLALLKQSGLYEYLSYESDDPMYVYYESYLISDSLKFFEVPIAVFEKIIATLVKNLPKQKDQYLTVLSLQSSALSDIGFPITLRHLILSAIDRNYYLK